MSSNAVPSHEPTLLGLPLELLCKVFGELNDESLPSIRLARKSLDAGSFDKFAQAFINGRACYIFEEARWKLLLNIIDRTPRLGGRLRELTFTDQRLGLKNTRDLNNVVLEATAKFNVTVGFSQFQELILPSTSLIFCVMSDLATKTPNVRVNLNFKDSHHGGTMRPDMHDTLFLAASTAKLVVRSLTLDFDSKRGLASYFDNFSESPQHSCTSSLQRLAYRKGNPHRMEHMRDYEQQLGVLHSIQRTTSDLQELKHHLLGWNWETQRMPFSQARTISNTLLVSDRLDNLRVLNLSDVDMLAIDLITVLSRCKSQLSDLTLRHVSVESGWAEVLRLLLVMPKLAVLLCNLLVTESLILNGRCGVVMFDDLTLKEHPFRSFNYREAVVMGLRKMLGKPLWHQPLPDDYVYYRPDVS